MKQLAYGSISRQRACRRITLQEDRAKTYLLKLGEGKAKPEQRSHEATLRQYSRYNGRIGFSVKLAGLNGRIQRIWETVFKDSR